MLSDLGFSILAGAQVIDATAGNTITVHMTTQDIATFASDKLVIQLDDTEVVAETADVFGMILNGSGDVITRLGNTGTIDNTAHTITFNAPVGVDSDQIVKVDYYVEKTAGVQQLEITPDKFGGFFYVEASTLFRAQATGEDFPAEIILPNVKIQSNFTFNMAATGDPSTFSFVMDAFPDYTKFDPTKKVLCAIQVIGETE